MSSNHPLLTKLLLPHMEATAARYASQGRIVALASSAHWMTYKPEPIRWDALNTSEGYQAWSAYGEAQAARKAGRHLRVWRS